MCQISSGYLPSSVVGAPDILFLLQLSLRGRRKHDAAQNSIFNWNITLHNKVRVECRPKLIASLTECHIIVQVIFASFECSYEKNDE